MANYNVATLPALVVLDGTIEASTLTIKTPKINQAKNLHLKVTVKTSGPVQVGLAASGNPSLAVDDSAEIILLGSRDTINVLQNAQTDEVLIEHLD